MEQENNCWQCGRPLKTPPPPPEPPTAEVIPDASPAAPAGPRFKIFRRKPRTPDRPPVRLEDVLTLEDLFGRSSSPESEEQSPQQESLETTGTVKRTMTTLTGEVVEVEEPAGHSQ